MSVRRELLDQVEAILPIAGDGIAYRRAHNLVGLWSPSTIQKALRALANDGRAISFLGVNTTGKPARFYRRAPAAVSSVTESP